MKDRPDHQLPGLQLDPEASTGHGTHYEVCEYPHKKRRSKDAEIPESELVAKAEMLWTREAQKQLAEYRNFDTLKKQFGLFLDE